MRVLLDTNVLVSGFTGDDPASPPVQLLDAWVEGAFELLTSDAILAEVTRTFSKQYFARRLSPSHVAASLDSLHRGVFIVPVIMAIEGIATHPEGDLVLAAAVSGGADYLVTGDTNLQALGSYENLVILSPRALMEILSAGMD